MAMKFAVLSRWAKAMTMGQSLISPATIALLAARAVNILRFAAADLEGPFEPNFTPTARGPFVNPQRRGTLVS